MVVRWAIIVFFYNSLRYFANSHVFDGFALGGRFFLFERVREDVNINLNACDKLREERILLTY